MTDAEPEPVARCKDCGLPERWLRIGRLSIKLPHRCRPYSDAAIAYRVNIPRNPHLDEHNWRYPLIIASMLLVVAPLLFFGRGWLAFFALATGVLALSTLARMD